MSATMLHPLAAGYLRRLAETAQALPRVERDELVAEIEAHLQEATTAGASDSEVLDVLDRLGDPREIVAAHLANLDAAPGDPRVSTHRGVREYAAILLLLVGTARRPPRPALASP